MLFGAILSATLIEEGQYLLDCLIYIQLNMVRCGVIEHPRAWEWSGYHELMGHRHRYRLLDVDRLCWRLRGTLPEVREQLEFGIKDRIARDALKRLELWSQSLAVGSRAFLERTQKMIFTRAETRYWNGQATPAYCARSRRLTTRNGPRKTILKAILGP